MATEVSRRAHGTQGEPSLTSDLTSRTDIKRRADERRMEREFAWAFSITLTVTTLYLIWRLPWGQQVLVVARHFIKSF